jgi:histidinol-phosphate aminotransferase
LIAQTPWVQELNKVRPPYNVSVLNAACASFALEHRAVFEAQATEIMAERERLFKSLQALPGLTPYPSQANMMLVRIAFETSLSPDALAQSVFEGLKDRGILVKNVSKMHPVLSACLRVTVGTPRENDALIKAFASIAQAHV